MLLATVLSLSLWLYLTLTHIGVLAALQCIYVITTLYALVYMLTSIPVRGTYT